MNFNLRINQKIIIDGGHDIDISDAAILDTMKCMTGASGIMKVIHNNIDYYWMSHQLLVDELPILRIKKDSMYRRIKKLIQKGYIQPHPKNKALRQTYYRVTPLTESIFSNIGKKSEVSEKNPKGIGKFSEGVSDENPKDNNTNYNKQTKEDFKEQSKRALELIAIGEKLEATLNEFCTLSAGSIEVMKNKSLFKGDHRQQITPFVEHNIENLLFRSSPITFFVKKFPQWLRYAKNPINRKKKSVSYHKIIDEYYSKEVRKKVLERHPERFKGYESEFNDVVVRSEVDNHFNKLKKVKNKTYTPYFVYDVCFGMMADKSGTKPERRFSKFRQWYKKLTEYQQNQFNLTQEFKKHLNR